MKRGKEFERLFHDYDFTVTRGVVKKKSYFSLVDLLLMIPSDWITMYYILVLKHDPSIQKIVDHFQVLIQSYMVDLGKFDMEMAAIIKINLNPVKTMASTLMA